MAMQQRFQRSLTSIFILSLIAVISACGGGGGHSSPPVVIPDTTPNAFSFTAVTGAAVSSEVTSAAVTITGIEASAAISITGGTYAIGTGAFTGTAGTVSTGQTVIVKVMASASNSTAVTATLTVGGVNGSFSVTTIADTTPNAFTLDAVINAQPNTLITSSPVIVAGIDADTPISITGGTFSIVGGGTDLTTGTISNGKTVTVKLTSADMPTTEASAILTIGGVSATYTVKTIADTVAPTAKILFPPPVSMTEGNTILVRGTASAPYSIKSVKVKLNGVSTTAITTDGFANWQALVPLTDTTVPVTATTENTLTVVAENNNTNVNSDAAHVAIRQAPLTSSFPDSDNQMESVRSVAIDNLDGRNKLLATGARINNSDVIFSIDLATGKRTIFATVDSPFSLAINHINKRLYVFDSAIPVNITDFDLSNSANFNTYTNNIYTQKVAGLAINETGGVVKIVTSGRDGQIIITAPLFSNFNMFSDATQNIPDALNPINRAYGMAFDKTKNRYLVLDNSRQTIFAVDAITGIRTVFSNNSNGNGELFKVYDNVNADTYGFITAIAIDEVSQRAIVSEKLVNTIRLFAVDLTTGNRSLIFTGTPSDINNVITDNFGIAIVDSAGYALLSENIQKAIFAVDLVTGKRVVFSKN